MAFETAFLFAQELLKLNAFLLLGFVFAFAFIAFKFFAYLLRVLATGAAFGSFPIIANLIGIPVPITIQSILWSALAGIMIFFVYTGISFTFKVLNTIFSPLKKGFSRKPGKTVVVKRVEKRERED